MELAFEFKSGAIASIMVPHVSVAAPHATRATAPAGMVLVQRSVRQLIRRFRRSHTPLTKAPTRQPRQAAFVTLGRRGVANDNEVSRPPRIEQGRSPLCSWGLLHKELLVDKAPYTLAALEHVYRSSYGKASITLTDYGCVEFGGICSDSRRCMSAFW